MKKFFKRLFMIIVILIAMLIAAVYIFLQQPQFGKTPSGERLERIKRSPNYKDGKFQNLNNTPDLAEGVSYYTVMKDFFFAKDKRNIPSIVLPNKKVNLKNISSDKDLLVWFGHSSIYMQLDGKRILIDPVLSGSASPLKFTTPSFKGSDVYTVDDFPAIDYLFISHDHWDHLDYETILKLKPKVTKVITSLGTGAHFEHWGYSKDMLIEKDWYEGVILEEGFEVTFTPARHFSGRGLSRNLALWTSFVLKTPKSKIYIGGDSGYDTHFKQIGETYGPFDLAILECGQYNEYWKYIHMMPEEVVQASIDLKAKMLMPAHWSKFSLALHAWDESIIRVTEESKKRNMPIMHPFIGEAVYLKDTIISTKWWVNLD